MTDSRQVRRAKMRRLAFAELRIDPGYSFELRRDLMAIARVRARTRWIYGGEV